MNPDEFNTLAQKLDDQLNQKGTLIRFHVPHLDEYLERYPVIFRNMLPETLAVEWSIKIEKEEYRGSALFTVDIISRSTNVIEYILNCAIEQITDTILSPKKVETIT